MQIVSVPVNTVKAAFGSTRLLVIAGLAMTIMILTITVPRFAAYRSAAQGRITASANKQAQGCCSQVPATLRRMIGTYYTTENNFKSTLILNNKGPNQLAVTPILHGQSGQTFSGLPVTVSGESSLEVDLNAMALSAGSQFRSGSFEFTYIGRMLEMGGGLRIIDAAHSLIFDEQLLEPGMKFSSAQLEAVYAIPYQSAKVSAIVTNTSAQILSLDGSATFAGINALHPINGLLRPYETRVIDLPSALVRQVSAGAVSLSHNGEKGALLAIIHVQELARGFSASVNFNDPAQGKTTQLHGAGLRLGQVSGDALRPVIVVRNTGNSPTTVTTRVPFSKQDGETGTIPLPQVSLAAGEIRFLDTTNPNLSQPDFATAGLELEYTGAPGSVIASAHSASQSGTHVFTLPLKDPQGGMSSTGGYPWFINGTASTVVFIKNTTNEPRQFHLTLSYQGGKWGSNLKTLAPGQTYLLDVRKVRDEQEQGSDGSLIPPDVTSGHVAWSVRGGTKKALIGRAQTVDLAGGMAATYECQCLCQSSYYQSYLTPGSVTGFPGDVQQFLASEVDRNCYGTLTSPYTVYASFESTNPDVATCSLDGLGTAQAPGTTNINAYYDTAGIWTLDAYGADCTWEPFSTSSSAGCVVDPRVRITEVGFKNDHPLRTWHSNPANQHQIDETDGTEPTWKKDNNPNYPAAYTVSSNPVIFAKLTVTPTPSAPTVISIRIKIGSNVVAVVNGVDATSGVIVLPTVELTQALPATIRINKYDYKWEVFFESGNTWKSIGDSGEHKLYTIAGPPQLPTFESFVPTGTAPTYAPLYTLALEKACKYIDGASGTINDAMVLELAKGTSGDTSITYNPGFQLADHPLKAYGGQCLGCSPK